MGVAAPRRQLFGLNAGVMHSVNLLLHIANVLLLFWILARATGAPGRSAFVAALFAVHPMHVESVAWISERKDVLSTLFWAESRTRSPRMRSLRRSAACAHRRDQTHR